MNPPISSLAARESARRRLAGLVLAGEHALRERRPHDLGDAAGVRTAGSPRPRAARQSIEYCGWLETKRSTSGQREGRFDLLHGPFAEADVARLARAATTSVSASIVSSQRRVARRSGGTGRGRRGRCAGASARRRSACGSGPPRALCRCRTSGSRPWSRARRRSARSPRALRRAGTRRRRARRRWRCR